MKEISKRIRGYRSHGEVSFKPKSLLTIEREENTYYVTNDTTNRDIVFPNLSNLSVAAGERKVLPIVVNGVTDLSFFTRDEGVDDEQFNLHCHNKTVEPGTKYHATTDNFYSNDTTHSNSNYLIGHVSVKNPPSTKEELFGQDLARPLIFHNTDLPFNVLGTWTQGDEHYGSKVTSALNTGQYKYHFCSVTRQRFSRIPDAIAVSVNRRVDSQGNFDGFVDFGVCSVAPNATPQYFTINTNPEPMPSEVVLEAPKLPYQIAVNGADPTTRPTPNIWNDPFAFKNRDGSNHHWAEKDNCKINYMGVPTGGSIICWTGDPYSWYIGRGTKWEDASVEQEYAQVKCWTEKIVAKQYPQAKKITVEGTEYEFHVYNRKVTSELHELRVAITCHKGGKRYKIQEIKMTSNPKETPKEAVHNMIFRGVLSKEVNGLERLLPRDGKAVNTFIVASSSAEDPQATPEYDWDFQMAATFYCEDFGARVTPEGFTGKFLPIKVKNWLPSPIEFYEVPGTQSKVVIQNGTTGEILVNPNGTTNVEFQSTAIGALQVYGNGTAPLKVVVTSDEERHEGSLEFFQPSNLMTPASAMKGVSIDSGVFMFGTNGLYDYLPVEQGLLASPLGMWYEKNDDETRDVRLGGFSLGKQTLSTETKYHHTGFIPNKFALSDKNWPIGWDWVVIDRTRKYQEDGVKDYTAFVDYSNIVPDKQHVTPLKPPIKDLQGRKVEPVEYDQKSTRIHRLVESNIDFTIWTEPKGDWDFADTDRQYGTMVTKIAKSPTDPTPPTGYHFRTLAVKGHWNHNSGMYENLKLTTKTVDSIESYYGTEDGLHMPVIIQPFVE